jgi:hypothetical protein
MKNYQEINTEICQLCDTHETIKDSMENITYSFNKLNINNKSTTLLLEKLLKKFTQEMKCEKMYNTNSRSYYIHLTPPNWFSTIDYIYQEMLLNLIKSIFDTNIKKIDLYLYYVYINIYIYNINNMDNMNDAQARQYICDIINRMIREKCLYTTVTRDQDNKIVIKLNFFEPEWFIELDDITKHNVEINIRDVYGKHLIEETKNLFKTPPPDDVVHRKKRAKIQE